MFARIPRPGGNKAQLVSRVTQLLLLACILYVLISPSAFSAKVPRSGSLNLHRKVSAQAIPEEVRFSSRTDDQNSWSDTDASLHRRYLLRATLAPLALMGSALLFGSSSQAVVAESEVDIYFGAGNFWRLQHEFVMKEALDLGRREGDITSVTGYAGGKRVGELDRICYSGWLGAPDHVSLGHSQVVQVSVPVEKIKDFVQLYLDEGVSKRKMSEKGPQYRAVIGLRGGMKSKYFPAIQEACEGKIKIVKGEGNEPDNFEKGTLYLYDSKFLPYRPAELGNQFRDDPPTKYPADYHQLNDELEKLGILLNNGCP